MKLIVAAAISAVFATVAWNQYDAYIKREEEIRIERERAEAPATDWFVVQNLSVADSFAYNYSIPVIYDREIKKDFAGEWWAEVKNAIDKSVTDCRGHNSSKYTVDDSLPPAGVDLEWMVGMKCHLGPGQYYLEINYVISPINYPDKEYRAVSNVFTLKKISQSRLEGMPYAIKEASQ